MGDSGHAEGRSRKTLEQAFIARYRRVSYIFGALMCVAATAITVGFSMNWAVEVTEQYAMNAVRVFEVDKGRSFSEFAANPGWRGQVLDASTGKILASNGDVSDDTHDDAARLQWARNHLGKARLTLMHGKPVLASVKRSSGYMVVVLVPIHKLLVNLLGSVVANIAIIVIVLCLLEWAVRRATEQLVLNDLVVVERDISAYLNGDTTVHHRQAQTAEVQRIFDCLNELKTFYREEKTRFDLLDSISGADFAFYQYIPSKDVILYSKNLRTLIPDMDKLDIYCESGKHPSDRLRSFICSAPSHDIDERVVRLENGQYVRFQRMHSSGMYFGTIKNVNEEIVAREAMVKRMADLHKLADTDTLTGLLNIRAARQAISEFLSDGGEGVFMIMDMDNFKRVNDELGHARGDQVLTDFANVLHSSFRSSDVVTRMGGDEFIVFCEGDLTDGELHAKLERLMANSRSCLMSYKKRQNLSISVGVARSFPKTTYMQLYERADKALYMAKNIGKDCYHVYDELLVSGPFGKGAYASDNSETALSVVNEKGRQHMDMHQNGSAENPDHERFDTHLLCSAIDCDEFKLYIQPKCDARTGRLSGAEALTRWIRSDGTVVSPATFVPDLERSGLCLMLDEHMLSLVCQAIVGWKNEGLRFPQVSVNFSRADFEHDGFVEQAVSIIDGYGVDHGDIAFEILETMPIDDLKKENDAISSLRAKGFAIALDDFGTEYSDLFAFSSNEIDRLKIARELVLGLDNDVRSRRETVLRDLVDSAHRMNVTVVVEGVEDKDQLDFVRAIGADQVQGYLYSRPIPVDRFADSFLRIADKAA